MTREEVASADPREDKRFARAAAHELVLELMVRAATRAAALDVLARMRELIDLEWPPGLGARERFLSAER
jgi:hypothetical protein